jgi:hypothetical protein
MIDEMMHQLAGILPPEYRGQYAEPTFATERYIIFD